MGVFCVMVVILCLPIACWYEKYKGANDYKELERKRKERGYK